MEMKGKFMTVINDKKSLSDKIIKYFLKNKDIYSLRAMDIYNQFMYDEKIQLTDDNLSDWLLGQIADMLLTDPSLLQEAADI